MSSQENNFIERDVEIALIKQDVSDIKQDIKETKKELSNIAKDLRKMTSKLFKDDDTGEEGLFNRVKNNELEIEITNLRLSKTEIRIVKAAGFFSAVGIVVGYFFAKLFNIK